MPILEKKGYNTEEIFFELTKKAYEEYVAKTMEEKKDDITELEEPSAMV